MMSSVIDRPEQAAELRALVLANEGRDAKVAGMVLSQAGFAHHACRDFSDLVGQLQIGAGMVIVVSEALAVSDIRPLTGWLHDQPAWSDLPILLLTHRPRANEHRAPASHVTGALGNVTFLERPFYPATLTGLVRAAMRSRLRQYEARANLLGRAQATEALRESESRLLFALEAGALGAWSSDVTSDVFTGSAEMMRQLGLPADARLTCCQARLLVHPDDRARTEAAGEAALASGRDAAMEARVIWPDGSVHWLDVRARAIDQHRLAGVSQDVTERKRADRELHDYRERLEDLVAQRTLELEDANAQIRAEASEREQTEVRLRQAQKMEAVGQLTGGIAHDFNNLLSAIMGTLDLIRGRAADERTVRLANNGLAAVHRAARLTSQLLAFSRTQRMDLAPVRMNALIEDMRDLLDRSLGPLVELRLVLDPKVVAAIADANQIELAILNLAINARDAMPKGGRLTISTARTRQVLPNDHDVELDLVAITVADTGTGMTPEVMERAFDPFFTTKELGKGTGLGLSQVYGIARQSGGAVTIDSAPGRGTAVRILLPEGSADAEVGPVAEVTPPELPERVVRQRILVVDDDDDVRRFLVECLRTLGYIVTDVGSAGAALDILEGPQRPHLMITDYALPGMSGAALAHAAIDRFPDIGVIVATGYEAPDHDALPPGRVPVLRKPFRIADLARAIESVLPAA